MSSWRIIQLHNRTIRLFRTRAPDLIYVRTDGDRNELGSHHRTAVIWQDHATETVRRRRGTGESRHHTPTDSRRGGARAASVGVSFRARLPAARAGRDGQRAAAAGPHAACVPRVRAALQHRVSSHRGPLADAGPGGGRARVQVRARLHLGPGGVGERFAASRKLSIPNDGAPAYAGRLERAWLHAGASGSDIAERTEGEN